MNKSIYNIEREYLEIAEILQDNGGELTEETETALAINREELEVKAANYGYVIKSILDSNNSIDSEMERLTALRLAGTKSIDRLKYAVHTAMDLYGIEEIKMNNIKINFRKSTSVVIDNEGLIPFVYQAEKITTSIKKKEIGDALKSGVEVPGAYLSSNKSLQIK